MQAEAAQIDYAEVQERVREAGRLQPDLMWALDRLVAEVEGLRREVRRGSGLAGWGDRRSRKGEEGEEEKAGGMEGRRDTGQQGGWEGLAGRRGGAGGAVRGWIEGNWIFHLPLAHYPDHYHHHHHRHHHFHHHHTFTVTAAPRWRVWTRRWAAPRRRAARRCAP